MSLKILIIQRKTTKSYWYRYRYLCIYTQVGTILFCSLHLHFQLSFYIPNRCYLTYFCVFILPDPKHCQAFCLSKEIVFPTASNMFLLSPVCHEGGGEPGGGRAVAPPLGAGPRGSPPPGGGDCQRPGPRNRRHQVRGS